MSLRDTPKNTCVGYDIDIMTELAKDLGLELELVPTDWKTLVAVCLQENIIQQDLY